MAYGGQGRSGSGGPVRSSASNVTFPGECRMLSRTVGASVGWITGVRARWTRVNLRLSPTGVALWRQPGLGLGVDPRTARSIGAGVRFGTWRAARVPLATLISAAPYRGARCPWRQVTSVGRNRGRLWRRDAVFRIYHRRGRIWRATIKTAIIKTWGGATVQADGYDRSCGGEREHTHDDLLLSGALKAILI